MKLHFGLEFEDLYHRDGLLRLDAAFITYLREVNVELHNRLMAARSAIEPPAAKEHSQLLLDLAPEVEEFIAGLFGIQKDVHALAEVHDQMAPIFACKRLFVQRRAAKALKPEEAARVDGKMLLALLPGLNAEDPLFELVFSKLVMSWLENEEQHKSLLEVAARYAAWALFSEGGRAVHGKGVLFQQPKKLEPEHLVACDTEERDGVQVLRFSQHHHRARAGFALTDDGGPLSKALDQAHYCIFCHNQGKDSCSKGMKEKTGEYKKNALDITLAGCPLEEHISEMNTLKSEGVPVGALAVVTVNNPMCAGTGNRICNDCMKSCIYQKQEPVNIPLVETHVLKNVLALPYGFEIYSLLTRWNPLNIQRPVPKAESGYKVLVVGMGPAGYTLAHHLMNDGHTVVGTDGLKIEPLPAEISGVKEDGSRVAFKPIHDISELFEALDERTLAGFGGVAEYGITVRWDKNFLKVLRLLLERRAQFALHGGVRFGSSITYDNARAMGFDHIALAMGAGKPTVISMKNGLARGVRTASDFLMALQLTGAAKADSIANLQLRLPVVVIGGGLTAVDTATESLAYYPVQVEKFLARYEALVAEQGEAFVRSRWSQEDTQVAEEFIAHGRAIRAEKAAAKKEGREANVWRLLDEWGGVKLVYRKRLIDAPSYRLNHEEVEKAFEEGIFIAENYEPEGVETDAFGAAKAIALKNTRTGEIAVVPARSILVAAGTSPNTVLAREDAAHFALDGKYFRATDLDGNAVKPQPVSKPDGVHVLISQEEGACSVSFFGDLHPSFAGNVVKAMGSAKQGYPVVSAVLAKRPPVSGEGREAFFAKVARQLVARVHAVNRLTPTIVEVVLDAPLAAQMFEPGQFYRLQNYEANALRLQGTVLAMEGLAMTGAWVDKDKGLISVIALEMGGSSDLCAHLQPGENVVLMGPTGTPTHIPEKQDVLLVGGGLGNAVLFSIGKAMREKGCRVLYFAGYKKAIDRYKVAEIEAAADVIVWCCDESSFTPERPQDKSFHGNIVEAIRAYGEGKLGSQSIGLSSVEHIIAIGSDRMMAAVAAARHGVLHPHLKPSHLAIGSINSPMQCMMKEICAQCLQRHVDPVTGKESYVYSCFNQDQALDSVDFGHLNERLKQNSVQEKVTALWIDACLRQLSLREKAA